MIYRLKTAIPSWLRRCFIVCGLSALLPAMALQGASPAEVSLEYRVKAAFLINFAKFAEWPDRAFSGPSSPIVFVIAGDVPFGNAFDGFRGRTIGDRPIVIHHLRSIDDLPFGHVLFLSRTFTGEQAVEAALRKTADAPLLTVMDGVSPADAHEKAMINLFIQDGRVAFTINNGLARRSGLGISVRLLNLASAVVH